MGWFAPKKEGKGENLPELPGLPDIPMPIKKNNSIDLGIEPKNNYLNVLEKDPYKLPDLPQQTDKETSTISTPPLEKSRFSNQLEVMGTEEIESPRTETISAPKTRELGLSKTEGFVTPMTKKTEPIFIRLDKFETAVMSFKEIQEKVIEIEDILMKTKDIKAKEEQELQEWEREIQVIKSRLDSIDKNLLSRLD